jgi:uncharacterized protein (UPF0303 family)
MSDQDLLERVKAEEEQLRFGSFDHADAWWLGERLVSLGRERRHPIAVVVTFGPQRVFHAGLPGSSADNDAWVDRKVRSVEHFGTASLAVGASFRVRGRDFGRQSGLNPRRYSEYGGGFPLRVGDCIIGVVAVSGLPQTDDHALVVEVLRELWSAQEPDASAPGAAAPA